MPLSIAYIMCSQATGAKECKYHFSDCISSGCVSFVQIFRLSVSLNLAEISITRPSHNLVAIAAMATHICTILSASCVILFTSIKTELFMVHVFEYVLFVEYGFRERLYHIYFFIPFFSLLQLCLFPLILSLFQNKTKKKTLTNLYHIWWHIKHNNALEFLFCRLIFYKNNKKKTNSWNNLSGK